MDNTCKRGHFHLCQDAEYLFRENIHLQPYKSEEDFYARLYPRYLAVLEKARQFLEETRADPERTTVYIR